MNKAEHIWIQANETSLCPPQTNEKNKQYTSNIPSKEKKQTHYTYQTRKRMPKPKMRRGCIGGRDLKGMSNKLAAEDVRKTKEEEEEEPQVVLYCRPHVFSDHNNS